MNILLIRNSKLFSSKQFTETNITGIYPPLGLAYIASVLRDANYNIKILDLDISSYKYKDLQNYLKCYSPDIILLTTTTLIWPAVFTTAKKVKEILPNTKIGIGGAHLSVYPCESLSNDIIDFGIYGEGEITILEVIRNIEKRKGLDNVRGCVFRKGREVIVNPPRKEISDLNQIPFPSIDLLPYKKYIALSVNSPFFTMVTSRGCPYKCNFCYQDYLGKYRYRNAESVVDEMEWLVKEYGIKEIVIFDETFAIEKERVLRICNLINEKKLSFRWDIRTRVDLLDGEILRWLKNAGCYRLHLGIESGRQSSLDRMNKGFRLKEVKEKVKLAKKIGFELRGYFMLAYPGETCRDILETINFAKSLPLDWASFTITIGLPGTKIYKEALDNRYFEFNFWREYTLGHTTSEDFPYFIPNNMNKNELIGLKKKAYWGFYSRPKKLKFFLKRINFLEFFYNLNIYIKNFPYIYNSIVKR